jgi:hypothetical protein
MVDQENQQQQVPSTQQKTDPKGHGHQQFKRNNYEGNGEKEKDPDAIPILKYGPSNNFMLFKEEWIFSAS